SPQPKSPGFQSTKSKSPPNQNPIINPNIFPPPPPKPILQLPFPIISKYLKQSNDFGIGFDCLNKEMKQSDKQIIKVVKIPEFQKQETKEAADRLSQFLGEIGLYGDILSLGEIYSKHPAYQEQINSSQSSSKTISIQLPDIFKDAALRIPKNEKAIEALSKIDQQLVKRAQEEQKRILEEKEEEKKKQQSKGKQQQQQQQSIGKAVSKQKGTGTGTRQGQGQRNIDRDALNMSISKLIRNEGGI
ncbi:MAG: hypothetical protein EZS28_053971, partial [Streblomastix strix]